MKKPLPYLYPIVNLDDLQASLGYIQRLFKYGARILQLRDKTEPQRLHEVTCRAVKLAQEMEQEDQIKRFVIVNDNPKICQSANADGLHIGQEDITPIEARRIIGPKKILGLSAGLVEHITAAPLSIIDYIGFGPVFPTPTKVCSVCETGLELLAEACRVSPLPVVAIGGISLERAGDVYATGAASISVISALAQTEDLGGAIRQFGEAFEKNQ